MQTLTTLIVLLNSERATDFREHRRRQREIRIPIFADRRRQRGIFGKSATAVTRGSRQFLKTELLYATTLTEMMLVTSTRGTAAADVIRFDQCT